MSTRETMSWDTHLCLELCYDYCWYEHGLHASLLWEVFRSESRDEILLRGRAVTPLVFIFRSTTSTSLSTWYRWIRRTLGSNYFYLSWFLHRICFVCRECNIVFYFHLSGFFRNFRDVRNIVVPKNRCVWWLFKIHRSREYEFGSPTHSNDFIPGGLICTRQLRCWGKIICIASCLRKIVREVIIQLILQHVVSTTKIAYTLAALVSAHFGRIAQSKLKSRSRTQIISNRLTSTKSVVN
jgi:hypothetical protein